MPAIGNLNPSRWMRQQNSAAAAQADKSIGPGEPGGMMFI
jgi:hypothetical protein